MLLPDKIRAAQEFLAPRLPQAPSLGLVLGTGLGSLADSLQVEAEFPFAEIPHMPQVTAEGHAGKLLTGKLAGKTVAVLQGRLHFYEGYSLEEITYPIRVLKAIGVRTLGITNIAGALNPQFAMGDLMAVTDHINLMPGNPLVGRNFDELGPRFPDMSQPYDKEYLRTIKSLALEAGIPLQTGVYACMTGPSLETAAEYRMLRILGADAIGMSTVPEVIVAVHAGLKTLCLSLMTDLCLPDALKPIDIPEILRVAGEAEPKMARLLRDWVAGL